MRQQGLEKLTRKEENRKLRKTSGWTNQRYGKGKVNQTEDNQKLHKTEIYNSLCLQVQHIMTMIVVISKC